MRVAIYCRVSTSDQSCDRQERDLLEYATRAGYAVVAIHKEIASGAKLNRKQRKAVMALAQARKIDGILVTELTRWGRSTLDLITSLQELQGWNVSLIAQTGLQFDMSTPQGKLIASLMASLAEFERDLLRERIKSGIANARAKGKIIGNQAGVHYKADKYAAKVLLLIADGMSYRDIAKYLKISKTTIVDIVKRSRNKLEAKKL